MIMMNKEEVLLKILREGITPATGCTEPIAVAYAVAAAKEQIEGNLESIHIQVDPNVYKNGLMVTIPGTTEKGLVAAAAFGFIAGDTKRRFRVIEGLTDKDITEARGLMEQKKIGLNLKKKVSVWISRSNLLPIRKKLELSF